MNLELKIYGTELDIQLGKFTELMLNLQKISQQNTMNIDFGSIIKGKDGVDGKDGITPHIGENGNWWIGETDTGVSTNAYNGIRDIVKLYSTDKEDIINLNVDLSIPNNPLYNIINKHDPRQQYKINFINDTTIKNGKIREFDIYYTDFLNIQWAENVVLNILDAPVSPINTYFIHIKFLQINGIYHGNLSYYILR